MAFTEQLPAGHTFVACRDLMDDAFVELYAESTAPVYAHAKLDARTYEAQLLHIMNMLATLYVDSGEAANLVAARAIIWPMFGETFETWKVKINEFFETLYTAYLI